MKGPHVELGDLLGPQPLRDATDHRLDRLPLRGDEHEATASSCVADVNETLVRLLCAETRRVQAALHRDSLPDALVTLRRMRKVLDLMSQTWGMLSTLAPDGARNDIEFGSGCESPLCRRLEFMLGHKQPCLLEPMRHSPQRQHALDAALRSPSLYDDVIALLARHGYAVGETALARDWALPYECDARVQAAWREVYTRLPASHELYQLAEALVDVAERFELWRFRFLATVERLFGARSRADGSSVNGARRRDLDHHFFPELWSVRTTL